MRRFSSLSFKVNAVLAIIIILFGAALFLLTSHAYRVQSYSNYERIADNYVTAASGYIKPESIDTILADGGDKSDEYQEFYEDMENFYKQSGDIIKYLYVMEPQRGDNGEYLFRVIYDSDQEDGDPYGTIVDMSVDYSEEIDTPLVDKKNREVVGPIVSEGYWGWLMSLYKPVFNARGETVCYIAVDMNMNSVMAEIHKFNMKILAIEFGVLVAMILMLYVFMRKHILQPLGKLERITTHFKETREKDTDPANEVKTKDEFESLYLSIQETEDVIIEDRVKMQNYLDKIQIMAYRDELTGIKNMNAYETKTTELAQQIASGQAEFAIVMIDMNGLKSVNDRYGHGYGNRALKTTSKIVCNVFKHSPVYRIGGDEFAVILEGEDYVNREELIGQLRRYEVRRDMNSERPWKQIAISLGIADYDPENHKSIKAVFDEADSYMYRHKEKLSGRVERRDD